MSLYVAYGSNLNVQQMSYRCPGATVAFTGYLINWKLLYRGSHTGSYATVKRQKGSRVPVAVWNIDSKNEKALDLYEGYPRFYKKRNVFVQLKNGTRKKAMISSRLLVNENQFLCDNTLQCHSVHFVPADRHRAVVHCIQDPLCGLMIFFKIFWC